MTQEVTRLQRERQTLEQQIADLFAFYAKQKQAAEASQQHTCLIFDTDHEAGFQEEGAIATGRGPVPWSWKRSSTSS